MEKELEVLCRKKNMVSWKQEDFGSGPRGH